MIYSNGEMNAIEMIFCDACEFIKQKSTNTLTKVLAHSCYCVGVVHVIQQSAKNTNVSGWKRL